RAGPAAHHGARRGARGRDARPAGARPQSPEPQGPRRPRGRRQHGGGGLLMRWPVLLGLLLLAACARVASVPVPPPAAVAIQPPPPPPNGNLYVRGDKIVSVNRENQHIVLSGTVRPEDIASDNSVLSSRLADARIDYYGSGVVGDKQNVPLTHRLFDWVWPF